MSAQLSRYSRCDRITLSLLPPPPPFTATAAVAAAPCAAGLGAPPLLLLLPLLLPLLLIEVAAVVTGVGEAADAAIPAGSAVEAEDEEEVLVGTSA